MERREWLLAIPGLQQLDLQQQQQSNNNPSINRNDADTMHHNFNDSQLLYKHYLMMFNFYSSHAHHLYDDHVLALYNHLVQYTEYQPTLELYCVIARTLSEYPHYTLLHQLLSMIEELAHGELHCLRMSPPAGCDSTTFTQRTLFHRQLARPIDLRTHRAVTSCITNAFGAELCVTSRATAVDLIEQDVHSVTQWWRGIRRRFEEWRFGNATAAEAQQQQSVSINDNTESASQHNDNASLHSVNAAAADASAASAATSSRSAAAAAAAAVATDDNANVKSSSTSSIAAAARQSMSQSDSQSNRNNNNATTTTSTTT